MNKYLNCYFLLIIYKLIYQLVTYDKYYLSLLVCVYACVSSQCPSMKIE